MWYNLRAFPYYFLSSLYPSICLSVYLTRSAQSSRHTEIQSGPMAARPGLFITVWLCNAECRNFVKRASYRSDAYNQPVWTPMIWTKSYTGKRFLEAFYAHLYIRLIPLFMEIGTIYIHTNLFSLCNLFSFFCNTLFVFYSCSWYNALSKNLCTLKMKDKMFSWKKY